jgi:hypothetical protein
MFSSLVMKIERNIEVLFNTRTISYKIPISKAEKCDIDKLVNIKITANNIEVIFSTKPKSPDCQQLR